ncbi:MAG: acetylglutamate kinase [Bacteroidaceae bacterium]|nr:acetylglutamate kinase [Bacteroidaceae bacterium]
MEYSIIKVGGAVVEDSGQLAILLDEFVKVQGPKVLVHGGGRTATQLAGQLGIESRMIGGRRITDSSMLRIVTMVYGGLVNKNIVAQLQARRNNALGLTGVDMNIVYAHRRPITPEGIDFGYVGDVDGADGLRLQQLLQAGVTPVIAPLTHDGAGNLLNINADTMAQTIAVAIASIPDLNAKVSLTFCFELPGVMRDADNPDSVISQINESDFKRLVAEGVISGGMKPKLENAFAALSAGVASVRITNIRNLNGGTLII